MYLDIPRVIVYERNEDCKLCGEEMNPGHENYYRGRKICPRCQEGLEQNEYKEKR
jgi:recombinational DNA repair protein (RecF pathway)